MNHVRHSSRYTLTAQVQDPSAALDRMTAFVAQVPEAEQARAFHDGRELTLTFRIPTCDASATALATALVDLLPGRPTAQLHTGVGVNRRLLAQQ